MSALATSAGTGCLAAAPLRRGGALAASLLAWAVIGAAARAQSNFVNWETPHVSPLALTPGGLSLLAVNTPDNRLEVFDVSGSSAPSPRRVASIPVGLDPVSVRARSDQEVWVVNHISESISIMDLPSGRVVRTIATGHEPSDVVFAAGRAFVTCSQLNQVQVYDLSNLAAAPTTVNIQGADPRMLAVSPDGSKVYAAIFGSGNATTAVRSQDVSNPTGPYAGVNPPPNSGTAFNPPLASGLPAPPTVGQIVKRDGAGHWRDDNGRDWSAFVTWNLADNDVAIIDATTLGVTYAKGMLSTVMALGVKPDGTVTPVGLDARNEMRFEPNVQGIFVRVLMGSFAPASPASTSLSDLNPHLLYNLHSVPQALRDLSIGDPRAIVWHPLSGRAYVAGMGSNNVIVTDGAGTRYAEINVGAGPTGLALSATASRLYSLNKFDASISAIDTLSNVETARVHFYDPTPAAVRIGRPFLYDTHHTSGLGQASCASCHIDGRSDFLAWDLGNPAGAMKQVNQQCFNSFVCSAWHPMKGPMVTQVLQGIVGTEPFHWRGDRENVAAFAPAFTGLQGMDAQPSTTEMQQFTDFVATIKYPPTPNRTLGDTLPATFPVRNGAATGDPSSGMSLFQSMPVIGSFKCVSCHTIPTGTNRMVDDALQAGAPQSLKMAQLRGLIKKLGFDKTSQQSVRGFGFNHDSEFDSLSSLLLSPGFNFTSGSMGDQQRRDIEAFLMCFPGDTHPAIGQQVMFDGTNNNDPAALSRLNSFVALANGTAARLVAKGRRSGLDRGWFYYGAGIMQSDRRSEQISLTDLRTGAAPGNEIVFMVVPVGSEVRIGVDRDGDGFYDRDEISVCADPADPTSFPGSRGCPDANGDLVVSVQDLFTFLGYWFGADPRADFNRDGNISVQDIFSYLAAWFGGC